jgi:hypothetical protein
LKKIPHSPVDLKFAIIQNDDCSKDAETQIAYVEQEK